MGELVRYHSAKSMIGFSTILCVSDESAHNFKVVFLIDHTTFWHEFMMHHAIEIKENREQNLYIWPNLMSFFWCWLLWRLPLGWLDFGFNVIFIHPWFVTSSDLSEQIWILARFMSNPSVKIAWHEPNNMPRSSVTFLIVIRRLTIIIFFTASIFSSIVDVLEQPGQASLRPSLNRFCPFNTVVEAWLRFCFWPNFHAQASMWELMRYHGANSMIGFSIILCISDEFFSAISA